jgi:predicted hotdog family 3-hydroxylacyl-ACP dehydratase
MSEFEDIEKYIPHRLPMRLVSELLCVEDEYAEAQATLAADSIGVDWNGNVEAVVLMEIIRMLKVKIQEQMV